MEIRTITRDDLVTWLEAVDTGFLKPADTSKEMRAKRLEWWDGQLLPERTRGVFDGDACVGTFRSFPTGLTVPGGAVVAADAITNVTVTATHRRRGLLSRMMRADLDAAVTRGEPLAILIAAEYPIYGRFGFGPAAGSRAYRIDTARTGGLTAAARALREPGGRIRVVDARTVTEIGPELHERLRRIRPGAIGRTATWWDAYTGISPRPNRPDPARLHAVYLDAAGEPAGLLGYRVEQTWEDFLPNATLTVDHLLALTPAAETALWEYCVDMDYVQTVEAADRPVDDTLPLLFTDSRVVTGGPPRDFVWVRLLDVPAALAARTYEVPGRLVFDVRDTLGHAHGAFALDAGTDGAVCVPAPAGRAPDLVLDVSVLGSLYLGGESARRLATAGLIEEKTPGAVARAEGMFRTARAPWCPDWF